MKRSVNNLVLIIFFTLMGLWQAIFGVYMTITLGSRLTTGDKAMLGVIFGTAAIMLIAALVLLIRMLCSRRKEKELRAVGTRVEGVVTEVRVEKNKKVRTLRLIVRVTHPLTGEEMLLRSAQAQNSTFQVGDPIGVYFDMMDETSFVIDIPWVDKAKEYNGY